MSIILCLIPAMIAAGLCAALPHLALVNLWRIPEMLKLEDVVPVLAQLKDADIVPAWPVIAVCGIIVFALAYLLRRHKIIAGLLIALLILAGILASLMLTYVNGVPVRAIAKIAIEYLNAGAF